MIIEVTAHFGLPGQQMFQQDQKIILGTITVVNCPDRQMTGKKISSSAGQNYCPPLMSKEGTYLTTWGTELHQNTQTCPLSQDYLHGLIKI